MDKIKRKLTLNSSGVVLTYVMIVLLVMTIIISGVVFITVGNLEKSTKTSDHIETYYVAEGGINYLTQDFSNKSNELTISTRDAFFTAFNDYISTTYALDANYTVPFSNNNNKASQALVWVTTLTSNDPDVLSYRLHSEGTIGSITRTLTKDINVVFVSGSVKFRDAIFSSGQIDLGNAKVFETDGVTPGSISTTSTDEDSITIKNSAIVGNVYISNELTPPYDVIDNPSYIEGDIITQADPTINPITLIPIPSPLVKLPYLKITSGTKKFTLIDGNGNFLLTSNNSATAGNDLSVLNQPYDLSTYPNNTAFTMNRFIVNVNTSSAAPNFAINVGSNNYTIVTNILWIEQPIEIIGTGTLNIIVRQNLSTTTFLTTYSTSTSANLIPVKITADGVIGNDTNNKASGLLIYVQKITQSNKPIQLKFYKGDYYFSIFAENLSYYLGGDVNIHGALATNLGINSTFSALELWSSGTSVATLYYMPNGDVSFQSSSIEITGAIVCKTLSVKSANSPTIIYSNAIDDYAIPGVIDVDGAISDPTIVFVKSATQE